MARTSLICLAAGACLLGCGQSDDLHCGPLVPTLELVDVGAYGWSPITGSFSSPTSYALDFGDVPIGGTSFARIRVLSGTDAGIRYFIADAGIDPPFGVCGDGPGCAFSDAGDFEVTFQPYRTAAVTASLTLLFAAPAGCPAESAPSITVNASGTGIQLSMVVQPSVLDFGDTPIGTTATRTVELTNRAPVPVDGISAMIAGGDAKLFQIDGVPQTLAANARVTITIRYSPSALESRSIAHITFSGQDGEKATLNLFGQPVVDDGGEPPANDAGLN